MSAFRVVTVEEVRAAEADRAQDTAVSPRSEPVELVQPQPPARKLCVRHQRMADEGTNEKLQKVCCWFLNLVNCIQPFTALQLSLLAAIYMLSDADADTDLNLYP